MAQDQNFIGSTQYATGNATAPGAGAVITGTTMNINTTGWYRVVIKVGYGSTAETAALNNFKLRLGGSNTAIRGIFSLFGVNNSWETIIERIFLLSGQSLDIATEVAASAGAICVASLAVHQLEN